MTKNQISLYNVNTLSSGRVEVIKKLINQGILFPFLLNSLFLNNNLQCHMIFCSIAFIWMFTHKGFIQRLKVKTTLYSITNSATWKVLFNSFHLNGHNLEFLSTHLETTLCKDGSRGRRRRPRTPLPLFFPLWDDTFSASAFKICYAIPFSPKKNRESAAGMQYYNSTLRRRLNGSGYFWIRNFFFPDSKISPSTRHQIRCGFILSLLFSTLESGLKDIRIRRMRQCGRKPSERKSCGFKNIRIHVDGTFSALDGNDRINHFVNKVNLYFEGFKFHA